MEMGAAASPALPQPGVSAWTEHKHQDGRIFWYNANEKRSMWEKPTELKTPRERAMEGTPWKAYKSGDRTYYVHSETKQSSWTLPQELQDLFKDLPEDPAPQSPSVAVGSPAPAHVVGMFPSVSQTEAKPSGSPGAPPTGLANGLPNRPVYSGPPPGFPGGTPVASVSGPQPVTAGAVPSSLPIRPVVDASAPTPSATRADAPLFEDANQAEDAFISLLRQKGVTSEWTWEQTMRTIVTEPLYKALKSLSERKAAFNKYIEMLRAKEREEQTIRRGKAAEAWKKLFAGKFKSHNSFETARKWFGNTQEWALSKDEAEARVVFESIIHEMRDAEQTAAREIRHRNMDMLMSLFKNFEMDVMTRWRDAQRTILESEEYTQDARLQEMDVADMITVFEEHMRVVEKGEQERREQVDDEKRRTERKRRTACKELMQELKDDGTINANSKWSDVYPLIKEDDRFIAILGQPGSTPLDYFYDIIDELDTRLSEHIRRIEKGFRGVSFEIKEGISREEFDAKVEDVGGYGDASEQERTLIFEDIRGEAIRRAQEERKRSERIQRHQAEDLRYAMKRVDPPLSERLELSFDQLQVLPEVTSLREWKDCHDDETRKMAWQHFVVRTKERQAEKALRDRNRGEHGRERERDRSHRAGEEGSADRRELRRSRHDYDAENDGGAAHDGGADCSRERKREKREVELDYSEPLPDDRERERDRDRKRSERRSGRRAGAEEQQAERGGSGGDGDKELTSRSPVEEARRVTSRKKRAATGGASVSAGSSSKRPRTADEEVDKEEGEV
ncbi:hypothetical protein K437DRAFT_238815 [Tilletiaria anomala UBC 951]|uniref:Formin binding protein n=1 Tax=Tilletiaria anomala (strain ATCC 24038 / CBS 436.72 / UBC 951) TaxID=1037660 RepID=A0A066VFK3_TILAU|nr:uncharacterized protein K437DRAFT_238815 [Tilletiaria anomala UBC 951]KDN40517.1 hypothetical protein K437DRAFT_238815 [Tilletiaria anomala UBC 951]